MPQTIEKRIAELRSEIDSLLEKFHLPEVTESLYQPMKYTLGARGKRIRPILVFLVGEGLGAKHEQLIPPALAVEILHTFTLVHDDIMDDDTHRRGRPTVHIKWDVNTAILSGDALMSLAFNTLMQTKSPNIARIGEEFSQAMLEICEGQVMDLEFEKQDDIEQNDYLGMVAKKTGRLLGLSCQLGALVSESDSEIINEMGKFGQEIGQAFQIQDDILEITSNECEMGKSLGSDMSKGKKTFPIVSALSGMDNREKENFLAFLKEYSNNRDAISAELQRIGALDQAKKLVNSLLEQAKSHLDLLQKSAQEDLRSMIRLIACRQS